MKLKIEKIYEDSKLPVYGYHGDAGMDLFAYGDFVIKPGERMSVPTGIKMAIPEGCVGLVWDKSGLAFKNGLKTLGGVIDSGYRGEIKICFLNSSGEPFEFKKGDKIAQMVIQPFISAEIEEGILKSETHRADKGFGSTGR